jgi:hypothetical protein
MPVGHSGLRKTNAGKSHRHPDRDPLAPGGGLGDLLEYARSGYEKRHPRDVACFRAHEHAQTELAETLGAGEG